MCQHSYVILVGQWKTNLANVQESARVMRILKLTPMSCDAKLIPDWWILAIWLFAGPVIIKRTMHIRFQISSFAISSLQKYQWTCKTTINSYISKYTVLVYKEYDVFCHYDKQSNGWSRFSQYGHISKA